VKLFGHNRPVRDTAGEIIGSKPSPVRVKTVDGLGYNFGPDKNKRLVLTAHQGDLIGLRPERTSRELKISANDLYAYMIRCEANLAARQKANVRKERKAERLARQRQERAEKRLFKV
jgi:hypothetical protein